MEAALYLLLGLAVVGALLYALNQVNNRQRQLHAELTRLERLSAEVTINAEAVLEQVDQRIERLNELATRIEERAAQVYEGRSSGGLDAAPRSMDQAPLSASFAEALLAARALAEPLTEGLAGGQSAPGSTETPASTETPLTLPQAKLEPEFQPGFEPEPMVDQPDPAPAAATSAERYAALRQSVNELAQQAKSPLEIAQTLGIPRGEVQLILNLKEKRPPAS